MGFIDHDGGRNNCGAGLVSDGAYLGGGAGVEDSAQHVMDAVIVRTF